MIDDYWAKLRKKQNEAAAAARRAQAKKAALDAELRKQLGAYYDDVANGHDDWAWAKSTWGWAKDHHEPLVHLGINVGVGFGTGVLAFGLCAETAGVACAVYAGIGIGMLAGMPAHLVADRIMGHATSASDAVSYFIGSAWRGGFQAGFRRHFEMGPAGKVWGSVKKLKFW
jgi:hypothetical protein